MIYKTRKLKHKGTIVTEWLNIGSQFNVWVWKLIWDENWIQLYACASRYRLKCIFKILWLWLDKGLEENFCKFWQ